MWVFHSNKRKVKSWSCCYKKLKFDYVSRQGRCIYYIWYTYNVHLQANIKMLLWNAKKLNIYDKYSNIWITEVPPCIHYLIPITFAYTQGYRVAGWIKETSILFCTRMPKEQSVPSMYPSVYMFKLPGQDIPVANSK